MRHSHLAFALLLLGWSIGSATAEPVCRTVLDDGRVVLSEPLRTRDGLACRRVVVLPHRPHAFGLTPPSMRFTTGPIGPFTTGSLPPLTTFSNSQPAAPLRH